MRGMGLVAVVLGLLTACSGVQRPRDPAPSAEALAARLQQAEERLAAGDASAALAEADAVIVHAAGTARAHRVRAEALLVLDRDRDAVDAAREVVRLDLENAAGWVLLAQAQTAVGAPVEGARSAAAAVRLSPNRVSAYAALADALLALGEPGRARRVVVEGLRRAPDAPSLRDRLDAMSLEVGTVE